MAKTFSLEVASNDDYQPFESGRPAFSLQSFSNFLRGCLSGARNGAVTMKARSDSVAASGTITLASCPAGQGIEVNGVTFRAVSGTPVLANNEFDISGADAADATSLAAAINACTHASISGLLTATSTGSTGVVTVTSNRKGSLGNCVTLKNLGILASAVITVASITANDTITLNGTALTSKQQRATGTLTCSTAIAGNTFSVNGYLFTGQASAATLGTLTFDTRTSDTACGDSIVAQINSYPGLSGIVTATNSSGTVTVRAVTAGTAGNSIPLTGTVTTLAASAATLTGGIAVANNEFEAKGTDTQIAADFVRALNASSTAALNTFVTATSNAAVITVWSRLPGTIGNSISVATANGSRLAITGSVSQLAGATVASLEGAQATGTLTLTSWLNGQTVSVNGVTITANTSTQANNQVDISGNDTADAAQLALAINNSTTAGLKDVVATSSSNVVTVTARRGGISGNAIQLSSGQASVVANVARLAGGAVPTTVVLSGDRLASGAETLVSFSF